MAGLALIPELDRSVTNITLPPGTYQGICATCDACTADGGLLPMTHLLSERDGDVYVLSNGNRWRGGNGSPHRADKRNDPKNQKNQSASRSTRDGCVPCFRCAHTIEQAERSVTIEP